MDGQPRNDGRSTPASDNPNVFDDEFAIDNDPLEPEFGVADGFRPDQSRQSSAFTDSPTLERLSVEESIPGTVPGETKSRPHVPSRGSTEHFAVRPESSIRHVSTRYWDGSVSEWSDLINNQSAFADPNVLEDSEETTSPAPQLIPVGFPGMSTGYHRQIGPDGEEQGLMGLDGHTEQLPPYSRYPEQGPASPVVPVTQPATPQESIALGNLNSPDSQTTLIRPNNGHGADQEVLERENVEGEEEDKVFGGKIPLWALILGFVIVFILAVILGGAIGGLLARENARLAAASSAAFVTVYSTASMYDASTIATPTGLASLPTHATYALPLGDPESSLNGCLPLGEQRSAWSCKIHGPDLRLSLDEVPGKPYQGACITPMDPDDTPLRYGMQPPSFTAQRLVLVHDYDDPSKGPAYHFSARYDKIVVVDKDDFIGLETIKKRDAAPASEFEVPQGFRGRREVQVGDLPWFCVWNDTFIEGFIYVNEDTAAAASSSSAVAAAASAAVTSSSSYPTTLATSPQTTSASLQTAPVASSPTPTSSDTVDAVTSEQPYSHYTHFRPGFPSAIPTELAAVSRPAMQRRYKKLPEFPRVVKIEERRLPNNPDPPYCQQWRVLWDGQLVTNADSNGNSIRVELEEDDPLYPGASIVETRPATTGGASEEKRSLFGKRKDPHGACHCQWSST
ncbi:hypothetical protein H2199_000423 [Coniosporium tulheliwenetii]|uniref:Uncharacterized protein n=1 Tax=Coniosporium tulheliwenetii TaxID=3383036 RepID=A0ACC2ZPZ3_9PEZI|nr:hypothetical protein H2199_000423 [Cladosporium sp. JES 115]